MTLQPVATPINQVKETPAVGAVPRFELVDWRTRLGVVAGITGRGEAGKPFDLGLWTSQPVGEVMDRWRAFRHAEPGFHAQILGTQVHGTQIDWQDRPATGWIQVDGVDGHATSQPGQLLLVTVADCIPVYLVASDRRAIALLHAGWRGIAGGILRQGVELLSHKTGCPSSEIVMHCGVGICGDCYEVGSEVMVALDRGPLGQGPWHVDLRGVLGEQGERLGIRSISTSQWCSAHDRDRFFSHRASAGHDGRMVAYLGIQA